MQIRPAHPDDTDILRAIAATGYAKYTPRIGKPPAPIHADFAGHIARGEAFVAMLNGLDGLESQVGPETQAGLENQVGAEATNGPGHKPQGIAKAGSSAAKALVAQTDQIAGYVICFGLGDALELDNLAVAPSHLGKGIGGALIRFVEARARAQGYAAVTLYTNVAMVENLRMYPYLGYQETGRRHQNGYDRVFFRKSLGANMTDAPANDELGR